MIAFLLAAVLAGAGFYSGLLKRQYLAQAAGAVRRLFAGPNQPAQNQDGTLHAAIPTGQPAKQISNPHERRAGARLSAAAVLSQLDPGVRDTWNDYLRRVSPLALQTDSSLEFFLDFQQAYELEVDKLAATGALPANPPLC